MLWRDISSSGIMIDPAAKGRVSPSLSCVGFFEFSFGFRVGIVAVSCSVVDLEGCRCGVVRNMVDAARCDLKDGSFMITIREVAILRFDVSKCVLFDRILI